MIQSAFDVAYKTGPFIKNYTLPKGADQAPQTILKEVGYGYQYAAVIILCVFFHSLSPVFCMRMNFSEV